MSTSLVNQEIDLTLPQCIIESERLTLPQRIIESERGSFRDQFNRSSFEFSHNLAEHPLFEIPQLVELANSLLLRGKSDQVTCLVADVPVDKKWGDIPQKEQVAEAIARIEDSGSWVLIKSVQFDPQYNILLEQIIAELEELTCVPLHQEITWMDAYIFIASPLSITPYHIDHEANFLLQIKGEKNMNLFDAFDRSILLEQEIESYYVGDYVAATYREENQSKASVYHLATGKGVHHPSLAPHWVKNGNNVSVSLSINFCMRSLDSRARVYQANHYLRKLGLQPTPPGKSVWKDKVKANVLEMLAKPHPQNKDELLRANVQRISKSTQAIGKLFKG